MPKHLPECYQVLERHEVFRGFMQLEELTLQIDRYDGTQSTPFSRELLHRGDAVAVLVHDPQNELLLMVEQFRVGMLETARPWCLEIVAGMIAEGESPEAVARRETREEAGVQLEQPLQFIADYYTSPGGCDERVHIYYTTADLSQAGGVHGLSEEHEDIAVRVTPVAQVLDWLERGDINNGMTLIACQWFLLQRLRGRL